MTKRETERQKPRGHKRDVGAGIFGSLTDLVETLGEMTSTGEKRSVREEAHSAEKESPEGTGSVTGNRFSRILDGLTDIAERLEELSEKGESLSKKGEFTFPSKEGGIKGVYGFSFRTGLRGKDEQIRVEPFGNIRKDKETGEAVVQEISEPLVDVFEDEDSTTLIAEMPGVGREDINIDVREDILTIQAQKGDKKYRKELLLHHGTSREKVTVTCNNGIVTIRCEKVK